MNWRNFLSASKCLYRLRYVPVCLIIAYRYAISPFFPPSCRFYPTCSSYALGVIKKYGLAKGGAMALIRILKCHPFHPGGHDPVP